MGIMLPNVTSPLPITQMRDCSHYIFTSIQITPETRYTKSFKKNATSRQGPNPASCGSSRKRNYELHKEL